MFVVMVNDDSSPSADPLRQLLARALRRGRWGKLCKGEPRDYTIAGERLSQGLLAIVLLGLVLFAGDRWGWSYWQAGGLLVLILVAAAVASLRLPAAEELIGRLAYGLLSVAWLASAVPQFVADGLGGLLLTHALPVALLVGVVGTWRTVRLALALPVVLPVALIIALLPLLSEDMWRIGGTAGWRLATFAGIAIGLPLALVIARQARLSAPETFERAVGRLLEEDDLVERTLRLLGKPKKRAEAGLHDDRARRRLRSAYERLSVKRRGREIGAVLGRTFKRQTILRLIPLTAGTFILVAMLIYTLAVSVVTPAVAS